jgi:Peptidase A4 family
LYGVTPWGLQHPNRLYAWTQFLPQQPYEQVISSLHVYPGDHICVIVVLANSEAFFVIANNTNNEVVSVRTPYGNTVVYGNEAGWIMERPKVNNVFTDLAQYMMAPMYYAFAGAGGLAFDYQGSEVQARVPNLESLQLTMKNGSDTLSEVVPMDEFSMLFAWTGFH